MAKKGKKIYYQYNSQRPESSARLTCLFFFIALYTSWELVHMLRDFIQTLIIHKQELRKK